MSVFKRAMDYLGLGADDAYDDYDVVEEDRRMTRGAPMSDPGRPRDDEYFEDLGVRPASRQTSPSHADPVPSRRGTFGADDSSVQPRPINPRPSQVRAVPGTTEPTTVRPRRFDQAQEVADRFKEGQPVIMNLEAVERDVARRLIDFASGLCYGLNGSMEKVATGVYLLKPRALDESRNLDN
jgi:cell division inhibitor SepF